MRLAAPVLFASVLIAVAFAACGGGGDPATSPTPGVRTGANATRTVAPTLSPAPTPRPVPDTPSPGAPLYIALGDSLSAGRGASYASSTAWVPLVHAGLSGFALLNLGVPGDDSGELLNGGPLDRALGEIEARRNDAIAGNEVAVITLEIGGNDLLDIYFGLVVPGTCPTVTESLRKPQCVQALKDVLARYRPNLRRILEGLGQAAPDAPVFLMTLYNPFSGGAGVLDQFGVVSLEGMPDTPFPEGLNDIIRAEGAAAGVHVVEWYDLFLGKVNEYISGDLIHPNDTGHRVMAGAVLAAVAQAGLPVTGS